MARNRIILGYSALLGLALFRQVRAGVPGGVRLYVNLLSQARALRDNPAPDEVR